MKQTQCYSQLASKVINSKCTTEVNIYIYSSHIWLYFGIMWCVTSIRLKITKHGKDEWRWKLLWRIGQKWLVISVIDHFQFIFRIPSYSALSSNRLTFSVVNLIFVIHCMIFDLSLCIRLLCRYRLRFAN